jgi:hypothetical protein
MLMKYHRLSTLLGAALITISLNAQKPVPGGFRADIQKIVADYPHQFAAIRGRLIDKSPQSAEYASSVTPDGSTESSVTSYSSGGKPVYSWQAVLLRTESFEDAAKKYKWAFAQLKGMNVTYVIDQYTLKGKLENPDESRNFSSSELELAAPPDPLRKLRIRVQLQYEMPEWKVSLMVFEKEREDQDMASSD